MLPVLQQPEPENFDEQVRRPGNAALQKQGYPKAARFAFPPLWRKVNEDMFAAYDGYCAYSAFRLQPALAYAQIDPFLPKSKYPENAYEWANYRLCSQLMNTQKGEKELPLDPFTLEPATYQLNLFNGQIKVNPELSPGQQQNADTTIALLRLNSPELVHKRTKVLNEFIDGEIGVEFLQREAPFIYQEVLRQDHL